MAFETPLPTLQPTFKLGFLVASTVVVSAPFPHTNPENAEVPGAGVPAQQLGA